MATVTIESFYKNGNPAEGSVGDGATILMYSDTYPATIIARTAKTITVQQDNAKVIAGVWPDYQYAYTPNADGVVTLFRFSTKRGWVNKKMGRRLLIGTRRYYQDPTF